MLSLSINIIINIMEKETQNKSVANTQTPALPFTGKFDQQCFPIQQPNLDEPNFGSAEIPSIQGHKSLPKLRIKERTRVKSQIWSHTEVKKVFRLYSEYGSQWKIIETQFQDRCANSIKNRFYTVVRTLLKLLFKWHPVIKSKLPHEIPSKIILKFYEGRQEFAIFKGLGKRILKMVDFNMESKELKRISQQNEEQLLSLYKMIFDRRGVAQTKLEASHSEKNQEFPTDNVYQKYQENEDNANPQYQYVEMDQTKVQTQTIPSYTSINFNNQCEGIVFFVPFANYYPPYLALM